MSDLRAIVAVCGTRPEVVKLAPVVHMLRRVGRPVQLIDTGQHPDLAPQMLREAGLHAQHALDPAPPGTPLAAMLARAVAGVGELLAGQRPPMVLVQGDTLATVAGAMAAAYAGLPVAHVEAGLRTGVAAEPFPEEMHRKLVAQIACLHFAPTRRAADALRHEGICASAIHVTGNSGVDAFHATLRNIAGNPALEARLRARFARISEPGPPLVLATVHRRENLGRLPQIAEGMARLARNGEARILLPLHPNPHVRAAMKQRLGDIAGAWLLPPVNHAAIAWLMGRVQLLLTDSGGLQEEAPSLGLRTLILRRATERQEAVECGLAQLVEPDADALHAAVLQALAQPRPTIANPFGDGRAAQRIANIIDDWLAARETEEVAG